MLSGANIKSEIFSVNLNTCLHYAVKSFLCKIQKKLTLVLIYVMHCILALQSWALSTFRRKPLENVQRTIIGMRCDRWRQLFNIIQSSICTHTYMGNLSRFTRFIATLLATKACAFSFHHTLTIRSFEYYNKICIDCG